MCLILILSQQSGTNYKLTSDSIDKLHMKMVQRYCNRRLQFYIINNGVNNTIQSHAECMNAKLNQILKEVIQITWMSVA